MELSTAKQDENRGPIRLHWPMVSLFLLAIYLAFFHFCLMLDKADYGVGVVVGIGCWMIWNMVCVSFRKVFLNRFEYWIHLAVGVDILLEGFNPWRDGLGFYYCAAGFWLVFGFYHWRLIRRGNRWLELESVLPNE